MKRKIGSICIFLGVLCILAGTALFGYNRYEAHSAEIAVSQVLPQVADAVKAVQAEKAALSEQQELVRLSEAQKDTADMAVVTVDGLDYIGYISISALGLELPVMAEWSYQNLRLSPCRYTGSMNGNDLVIMAHNYPQHFGNIRSLKSGDTVCFTNAEGETTVYEVEALDVLPPFAVEDMTAGEYDLTLFTCTYSGENRVTLRCDRTG